MVSVDDVLMGTHPDPTRGRKAEPARHLFANQSPVPSNMARDEMPGHIVHDSPIAIQEY